MAKRKKHLFLGLIVVFNVGAALYTFYYGLQTHSIASAVNSPSNKSHKDLIIGKTYFSPPQRPDAFHYKDFPNITYYVRTSAKKTLLSCFYCILLRTTVFFWPAAYGKMVLVLDKDSERDHEFGGRFQQQVHQHFPEQGLEVYFEPQPNIGLDLSTLFRGSGYQRQLWNTFFIDLFTNDEIIAYMDSDSQLNIPFTKEYLLGKDGRRKLWVYGNPPIMPLEFEMHVSWLKSTEKALGLKSIGCFMAAFPQLLYRDTIRNTRNYILRRFNTQDFAYVFRQLIPESWSMSPITIILNYAWYFERDRYAWHLNYPNGIVQSINKAIPEQHRIAIEDTKPTVIGITHNINKAFIPSFFIQGYCQTMRAIEKPVKACENIGTNPVDMCTLRLKMSSLHRGWPDYLPFWCKDKDEHACCAKSVQEHYRDVARMPPSLHRFNISKSKLVESLAKEMGVRCEPLQLPT